MTNKSENADIRELQTQMLDVNKNLDEVKADVKSLLVKFDEQKNLQAEIDNLRENQRASDLRHSTAIEELKKRRNFISIIVPVLVSVLTALLTFLVISFFTNVGKVTPNSPGTSTTTNNSTTTTTPSGSGGSSGTPSANASSNATSTPANPNSTDSQSSNGVTIPLPKVP